MASGSGWASLSSFLPWSRSMVHPWGCSGIGQDARLRCGTDAMLFGAIHGVVHIAHAVWSMGTCNAKMLRFVYKKYELI
ncbi:hypothetical protein CFC21_017567 [Triticum aestivum]|uniref:Uncharacterized protein n=3 Tax=Triticum TaxID=4564 RepID=A0A9R1NXF6_TRITD|nr:hypothetical protein CFC21_017567 [Triticum aestivum]VAH32924.1 unnamed protein product [Triticum turgidum subsp. durum]